MKCPRCGSTENRANNTQHSSDRTKIRRERKCIGCGKIWYTVEKDEFAGGDDSATVWVRRGSMSLQRWLNGSGD